MNLGALFASLLFGVVAPAVAIGVGTVFTLGAILSGILGLVTI